jgi:ABC-type glutathione transport system ATPase component
MTALVEARGLVKDFGAGRLAVDGVSLEIARGETFGLVGESGSGKSTVAAMLLGLERPTAGSAWFRGVDLGGLRGGALRRTRRHMQLVLQDPRSALNRRKSVERILRLPMQVHGVVPAEDQRRRAVELLEMVGLAEEHLGRRPHELSGGQCQRVGIARALAVEPDFLVLDESVASVDVVTQAQILNLLKSLQAELGLTYLFVSHDLAVVRYMSQRIAVMKEGKVVETGDRDQIFRAPRHDYTRGLIAAAPASLAARQLDDAGPVSQAWREESR